MFAIIGWLENLGTFMSGMVDLAISVYRGIADIAVLLQKMAPKIPGYFSWLPDTMLAIVVIAFGIAVIYKILGREG